MILSGQIIKEFKIAKYFLFAIVSGIITQIFFAIFKMYTLNAFVSNNESISPMTMAQTTSYVWTTQMLFAIVPWNVNGKDFDNVRTGSIASDLIKPVGLFKLIFVKTFSWRMVSLLTRAIPIFLIASVLFDVLGMETVSIHLPDAIYILMFIISVTLSIVLSTLITTLLYSIAFFFTSISHFIGAISSIAFVLSGMVIPLDFYPKQLTFFLEYQPFKFIVDTPALIFNETYGFKSSLNQLMLQLVWIIIFFLISTFVYLKIENKIEINGG